MKQRRSTLHAWPSSDVPLDGVDGIRGLAGLRISMILPVKGQTFMKGVQTLKWHFANPGGVSLRNTVYNERNLAPLSFEIREW